MSFGDWIKHPAFGVALFALLTLGPIALGQEYQIVSKGEHQTAATNLNDSRYFAPPIKTPVRNPEPDREEWRGEKDLQAQQAMAMFTVMMAVVTLAGVVFVARTLTATREATEAAILTANITRETGEAQARGYITLKPLSFTISEGFRAGTSFRLRFELTVSGQTPVYETRSRTTVMIPMNGHDPQQPENPRIHDAWRTHHVILPGQSAVIVSATGSTKPELRNQLNATFPTTGFQFPTFGFQVRVQWVDAFNYELQQDFIVYANTRSLEDHSTIAISIAVMSPINVLQRKRFPVFDEPAA